MTRTLIRATIEAPDDVEGFWRTAAALDASGAEPEDVVFDLAGETADLFGERKAAPLGEQGSADIIPAELRSLVDAALLHRDRERFALAYRLLRRLRRIPHLLAVASDRDVRRARDLGKAVHRDKHKMTAFVRFRETAGEDGQPVYIAWFEPDHHIVAATAPFFMRRFANMRWSILTPKSSAHWDGERLTIGAGARSTDAARDDPLEEVWRTYYAHIFNPSRLMPDAMRAHMPKKYWHNLPEAPLINPLIAAAQERSRSMVAAPPTVPRRRSATGVVSACCPTPLLGSEVQIETLDQLAKKGMQCEVCPLHGPATQAVPGEGAPTARLMLVGEQPGDEEDIAGRPFVGPAGRLLDIALERVGIARSECFVTNAVKHFKFEARGKRRLHKSPSPQEIERCRWWLNAERKLVRPELIVALGASAARSLIGKPVKIHEVRGTFMALSEGSTVMITVHPSYLLRLQGEEVKRREWRAFLADLTLARNRIATT